ncbi:uncharacterized protein LOC111673904 [Orussus abietinus]|uniref:uncharacterized protein LOC111673904 n=1 Tax=Orussus abietinus TaxID=222816 RepID=UPI000C715E6D|nr:uncharacterized protein LOC111673904 [Orussus abietinus]
MEKAEAVSAVVQDGRHLKYHRIIIRITFWHSFSRESTDLGGFRHLETSRDVTELPMPGTMSSPVASIQHSTLWLIVHGQLHNYPVTPNRQPSKPITQLLIQLDGFTVSPNMRCTDIGV